MLNEKQMERMLTKLKRYEETLEPWLFREIDVVAMRVFETGLQHHEIPGPEAVSETGQGWRDISPGDFWGREASYAWFAGEVHVPDAFAGQMIWLRPDVGGYEGMLWVDGLPYGTFATKIVQTGHGNHYCNPICLSAEPSRPISVAVEFYSGHYILGTQPFETNPSHGWSYAYHKIAICVRDEEIADFLFDLKTLNQLAAAMDAHSFRRADVRNTLFTVFQTVYLSLEQVEETVWRKALREARSIMAPALAAKNADSAPFAGLVGHSHMDTAWLWPIRETIKKCARTFSNQLSLMDRYPEYRFIQSSAYHLEMIRCHYPDLFKAIGERIREGRYEPNGGVWVECDCNITSGESMIRQFLWGQRYTKKHFDYVSDTFWLPDTFGYSASLPQIMKGCGVRYFLTTKMSWNDTNRFPHETFLWEGIDRTGVLTHFNTTHSWPDPATLLSQLEGRTGTNCLQNKQVSNRRLIAYGFGDGGGGPQFEMVEMARRVQDLDGAPRAMHTSVSEFMKGLEARTGELAVYRGELYLELHRGTLTNQHEIKRNNRLAEGLLHDLELLQVQSAMVTGVPATDKAIRPLMETLLVNQFHDILPGTCIAEVHDQCHLEMNDLLRKGQMLLESHTGTLLGGARHSEDGPCALFFSGRKDDQTSLLTVTFFNTLAKTRTEALVMTDLPGWQPENPGLTVQRFTDMEERSLMLVGGLVLPPLSGTPLRFVSEESGESVEKAVMNSDMPFEFQGNRLTTPFAWITFDDFGTITSFVDRRNGRELRGNGYPLNTFLLAEDLPASWDNWDVDADIAYRFETPAVLLEREVVTNGPLQFRLRSKYQLSSRTALVQDMVFHSDNPRVDFETMLDWQDKHRFLKTGFHTTIQAPTARHEIQFGYCGRPTTRNQSWEEAMFEVPNQRYTDLSETRYGVAMLNDCKYGISVEGGDIRLSLHKGGCRPDPRGDAGLHFFRYAFLPHMGGFSAENAVWPGYELNAPVLVGMGEHFFSSLVISSASHVVIETLKPCEDQDTAFILRLYECEGTEGVTTLGLGFPAVSVEEVDMLEEPLTDIKEPVKIAYDDKCDGSICSVDLRMAPFQIRSLRIRYADKMNEISV